jgi:hypothetical protein
MPYAPIVLFAYNRLDTLKCTLENLQNNCLAKESDIYIYSDQGKDPVDMERVVEVRKYLERINGFKSVSLMFSERNRGLANSVISGVDEVVKKYGKVIVVEDDLITSTNFLAFMNQCLTFYKDNSKVYSVSGYTTECTRLGDDDVYFTKRASSWGWATWDNRWLKVDWCVRDFRDFERSRKKQLAFNKMGSDLSNMLKKQMAGEIDSWAVRWAYHQFKSNLYTVYPTVSKVQNIGTSIYATHTRDRYNRFWTPLDSSDLKKFKLSDDLKLDPYYLKQFLKQFSILSRIKYKILNKVF